MNVNRVIWNVTMENVVHQIRHGMMDMEDVGVQPVDAEAPVIIVLNVGKILQLVFFRRANL